MATKNETLVLGFPLYPGCTLLDFAGATQVFAPWTGLNVKVEWIAQELQPLPTTEGVSVMPTVTIDKAPALDVLFVPGGGGDGVSFAMLDPRFQAGVRKLAEGTAHVGSVCTGAFVLAAAGLLDGYRATTYWSQLDNLALFPKIEVDVHCYPRHLFDRDRFTGGGVSSSIDLALFLAQKLRGATGDPWPGAKACMEAQLIIQYQAQPPYNAGDPSGALPELAEEVRRSQAGFIAQVREATEKVIGRVGDPH